MDYKDFLKTKQYRISNQGKEINRGLIHSKLFDWQKDIVQWACRKGRCAVFLDTGLGKTFIQLEWARLIGENTLIIAPLSVARQTVRESQKIELDTKYVRSQPDNFGIWVTNYEMIDNFDFSKFGAVVLDESSILKSIGGKTKKKLTTLCSKVQYRLCCTATPAPNDYIELGNHTEFLGICKQSEMLATFFINANKEHTLQTLNGETYRRKGSNANGTEWRLKHHAENPFFKWLSSWAITMTKPSDLGYDDNGFILPPLNITPIFISGEYKPTDQLFFTHLRGITDRLEVRQSTLEAKILELHSLLNLWYNNSDEQKRIFTEVDKCQSGTYQAIQGKNEGQTERTSTGTIRKRRISQNTSKATSKMLATGQPRTETLPATKAISNRPSDVHEYTEQTEQSVCDMRNTIRQPQDIPICRPLPQNRESQGAAMPELQSGDRQNEGLANITKEICRLFREQWLIWCGLDIEQKAVEKLLTSLGISFTSVYGGLSSDEKERRIEDWINGNYAIMISKPKVLGFGMNFQNSHNMVFMGLNDSWETYYQCIRRQWRYMQPNPVNVYLIMHEAEMEVYHNVLRKDAQAKRLKEKLINEIKVYEKEELGTVAELRMDYKENMVQGTNWIAMLGDSCERLKEIPDNSIDLSVYSPPFADLFTYTSSERDLGNCRDWGEFFNHYKFIIREILRVTKQGRLTCVHTSDIPALAQKDGYIGIKDFPGAVIKAY